MAKARALLDIDLRRLWDPRPEPEIAPATPSTHQRNSSRLAVLTSARQPPPLRAEELDLPSARTRSGRRLRKILKWMAEDAPAAPEEPEEPLDPRRLIGEVAIAAAWREARKKARRSPIMPPAQP